MDMEGAEETAWQEMVLRHLQLGERVSIEIRTELDFVGPIVRRVLRRHGVLWPLNIYLHESLIHHASGGSIMTGMSGDAVFSGGRWLLTNQLLGGRRRPRLRDPLTLGLTFSPRWIKQRVLRRRVRIPPWLKPAAREAFVRLAVEAEANAPRRWDRWMDYVARQRQFRLASESMALLAADAGTTHVSPLSDRWLLASIAKAGGKQGIGDRTAIMRSLFSGLLPDELLARPDKAVFGAAFVGHWTLEFARGWQGRGVDSDVVDPEILKASWLSEPFDFRAALLLQTAWLHQQR
jgi:asparagine synthase (glutamine-hydrolysing)